MKRPRFITGRHSLQQIPSAYHTAFQSHRILRLPDSLQPRWPGATGLPSWTVATAWWKWWIRHHSILYCIIMKKTCSRSSISNTARSTQPMSCISFISSGSITGSTHRWRRPLWNFFLLHHPIPDRHWRAFMVIFLMMKMRRNAPGNILRHRRVIQPASGWICFFDGWWEEIIAALISGSGKR